MSLSPVDNVPFDSVSVPGQIKRRSPSASSVSHPKRSQGQVAMGVIIHVGYSWLAVSPWSPFAASASLATLLIACACWLSLSLIALLARSPSLSLAAVCICLSLFIPAPSACHCLSLSACVDPLFSHFSFTHIPHSSVTPILKSAFIQFASISPYPHSPLSSSLSPPFAIYQSQFLTWFNRL